LSRMKIRTVAGVGIAHEPAALPEFGGAPRRVSFQKSKSMSMRKIKRGADREARG
jgi:hypothetical protein